MPRPICQEDSYDYHLKQIFSRLRKEHKDSFDSAKSFEQWIEDKANSHAIANAFIDDVIEWSGIPDPEDEDED